MKRVAAMVFKDAAFGLHCFPGRETFTQSHRIHLCIREWDARRQRDVTNRRGQFDISTVNCLLSVSRIHRTHKHSCKHCCVTHSRKAWARSTYMYGSVEFGQTSSASLRASLAELCPLFLGLSSSPAAVLLERHARSMDPFLPAACQRRFHVVDLLAPWLAHRARRCGYGRVKPGQTLGVTSTSPSTRKTTRVTVVTGAEVQYSTQK